MYTIQALLNSHAYLSAREMFLDGDPKETLHVVGYLWVIEGHGRLVAIDTGIGQPSNTSQELEGFTVDAGHDTLSLLKKAGFEPVEFDTLILTHLHWDHCLNVDLFRRATIVISEREWKSIISPRHPALGIDPLFPQKVIRYVRDAMDERVQLVGDDITLYPGIRLLTVGGHTPGCQAVAVSTKVGQVVIPSDTVFRYKNIEEDRPIGFYQNLPECYEAMTRIRAIADHVLPTHDPEVLERWPGGRIG